MKKFIQYTAILGAVLTVLGFGTAGAATINGARWDKMKIWKDEIRHRKERYYQIPVGADTGQEVDAVSRRFLDQQELYIELDYGNLVITAGEPDEILITCGSSSDFGETVWAYQDDGEINLLIYGRRAEGQKPNVQVFVPENHPFLEAEIEQSSGTCRISRINTVGFTGNVMGGELMVEEAFADCVNLEAAAGNITYIGETSGYVDIDCTAGNIQYCGRIMGDVEAQCATGNIELELYQEEKAFNYELDGAGGSIQLGETSLNGMVFSREINNGAPRNMELQIAAGHIQVNFADNESTVVEEKANE